MVRVETLMEDEWPRFRAVRLAALLDAPAAYRTTHAECVDWPESEWRECLRTTLTYVARVEDRDVGLVRGVEHPSEADAIHLLSMWVDPRARRRGVGRALIDSIVAWARSLDRTVVVLDVREHNHAAIALYESHGFVSPGLRRPGPPPDEHMFELEYRLSLG